MTEEGAKETVPAIRMTGKIARKTSTGDRGKCTGAPLRTAMRIAARRDFGWRKLKSTGGTRNPHSPVPGSPGPLPPPPARGRAPRLGRQPRDAPLVTLQDARDLLAEGLHLAVQGWTAYPACRHLHQDTTAVDGDVLRRPS